MLIIVSKVNQSHSAVKVCYKKLVTFYSVTFFIAQKMRCCKKVLS